jgi:hypothetical protein
MKKKNSKQSWQTIKNLLLEKILILKKQELLNNKKNKMKKNYKRYK